MHRLYVVHGSHPCAAAERALQLKGLPYRVTELPPPAHAAIMRARFGRRTVPALRLDGGEVVHGSSAIFRRLDALAPEPSLRTADPAIAAAETWGDEVWQPVARRLLWPAFQARPEAMAGFQEGSRLPAFPLPVLKAIAPVATRIERRLNAAVPAAVRADLQALDVHLDRIDGWLAEGTLTTDGTPSAADLQIASTTRLLLTIGDVRGQIDARPAGAHARAHFEHVPGDVPEGALAAYR
jgi:glutathione S-transferase